MKKQEVLDYMGLKELPQAQPDSYQKCIALVERETGEQDYAIWDNGGIVVDKKYRSAILDVIEFYPEAEEKEKPTPPPHDEPVEKPAKKQKFNRFNTIEFLKLKGEKNLTRKNNAELEELFNGYVAPTKH